jgi:hypothetical protein
LIPPLQNKGGPDRIRIVAGSPAHVGRIATRMREADIVECRALGHSPKQALREGLIASSLCLTALLGGRPEAMFGLVVTSALAGEGTPWMLGTEAIYDHPRAMLRWGPRFLAAMLDSTPALSNLVAMGNLRAIGMLGRWGFDISREPVVIGDVAFLTFRMEQN